jgi:hypothetical protein
MTPLSASGCGRCVANERSPWCRPFPPDPPPAVPRFCSDPSRVIRPAPTPPPRTRGSYGLGLHPPACFAERSGGLPVLARRVSWRARVLPTAPGSCAACDSATRDVAFPFCPQGRRPVLSLSRLHSRPASASVNASPAMSPPPPHDSRSAWFATPSLWGSFIPNSPPVYPGAFGQAP